MTKEYKINSSDYLQELKQSNYEIVKGEPDILGWKVKNQQQQTMGEVADLLFDAQARKVRYLILDLEGDVADLETRKVAVPIGLAQLHEKDDEVLLPDVTAAQVQMLPRYDRDTFNPEVENDIHQVFTGTAAAAVTSPPEHRDPDYSHAHYDNNNLYRNRKAQTVIGLFPDAGQAQEAVDDLVRKGFSWDNIEFAVRSSADPVNGYDPDQFDRFFDSLFTEPEEARRYRDSARNSSALIAVHAYSLQEAHRAADILEHHNNANLNDPADPSPAAGLTDTPEATTTIPIIEENVQIGKEEVETGGARLRSRIVERPVEENLQLRQERLRIERVPVNRPATDADLASFQEGSVELREYAEVPVVTKEARVVEEINIEKEVQEHEETIRETARSTDVQVDEFKNEDAGRKPDAP